MRLGLYRVASSSQALCSSGVRSLKTAGPSIRFSSTESVGGNPPPEIYLSHCTDPYFNLAFEDWLFRSKPAGAVVLLFYRNSPCVVIGRNQNPWKEINFPALRRLGVPFIRRHSGGGTVYHDLGNTNYSIAIPRTQFDRRTNAELIAKSVCMLGPQATVNDRNDVVVEGYKMSRSAYKISNHRAYHHGTMLIDAKLNDLGDLLHNTKTTMQTKGVDSVRSPVKNLHQFGSSARISHETFIDAVSRQFSKTYAPNEAELSIQDVCESSYTHVSHIQKVREQLQSWEWAYGQSPEFTHTMTRRFSWGEINASILSKRGVILSCDLFYLPSQGSPRSSQAEGIAGICKHLGTELVGKKYGILDGFPPQTAPEREQNMDVRREILGWLVEDM